MRQQKADVLTACRPTERRLAAKPTDSCSNIWYSGITFHHPCQREVWLPGLADTVCPRRL